MIMSNFDLIDDYLANRLPEDARKAFEENVKVDPALKTEVAKQRLIISGIQKARVAELKSMLNKVPVSTTASLFGEWSVLKIAATLAVAGLIGTTLYWFNKEAQAIMPETPNAEVKVDSLLPKEDKPTTEIKEVEPTAEEKKPASEAPTPKTSKPKKSSATTPKVTIEDPSSEMLTESTQDAEVTAKNAITISTIDVKATANPDYSFHYQFTDKKLFLYGPFDGVLYEILEVHGDNPALFLYFKDNFYHLNEEKSEPTELAPIRDRNLIQTLKSFRSRR